MMIEWLRREAPIRRKLRLVFDMLAAATLLPLGAIIYATFEDGAGPFEGGNVDRMDIALIAAATVTVAMLVAGRYFARLIATPYVTTVLRMEALAAGDLDSPIQFTDYKDCVGRMTKAMHIFRQTALQERIDADARKVLGELGTALRNVAAGDMTARLNAPFPPELQQLKADYNTAMEALHAALALVSQSATGIRDGSGQISIASDDLSRRTEQQAASLEQTAAAMDEIMTIVRQTAAGASSANTAVGEAKTDAQQSGVIVRQTVAAMNDIERSSAEISEIISVIDGIAFQTNLLALNAGVEAARAGDAGKGFAVVASEVRALAQRSADAAKDVKTRITTSGDQVAAGVALVDRTGQSLERIVVRIDEISRLVGAIHSSAGQQASGLDQVNTAVAELDGVTQQNAAMVEQATAAARGLASEADELTRQVGRFHLGGNAPRSRATPAAAQRNEVHRLQQRVGQVQSNLAVAAQEDWSAF